MKFFVGKEIALSVREDKLKKNMEESLNFFNIDCRNLLSVSSAYYPLEVLERAKREAETESKDEIASLSSRALPLLLQSLMQSADFKPEKGFSSQREIKVKDWSRIKGLAYDSVKRLLRYSENFAALKVKQGEVDEANYEIYRDRLVSQLFLDSVSSGDSVLFELCTKMLFYGNEAEAEEYFFTDAEFFSKEAGKLLSSLSSAPSALETERMFLTMRINSRMRELKASRPELTEQELYDRAVEDKDIALELDSYNRKASTYFTSSVEGASLLSSKTAEVFSLNVSSSRLLPFYQEGYFSAVYHPFIRFAGRYYTFLGPKLAATLPFAVRRKLHDEGKSFNTSGKITKIARDCLTSMMRETDIPDVFFGEGGERVDVVMLQSLRWINAWKHPVHFNERAIRREEEAARGVLIGHVLLVVDPDAPAGTFIQNEEKKFTISLNDLILCSEDEEKAKQFAKTLFGMQTEEETFEPFEELLEDDLYHKDEDLTMPDDLSGEEREFDEVYESEYEASDDDEKARAIESKFETLDLAPPEITLEKKPKEVASMMEKYEMPKDYSANEEEELSDDLDSEDYESEAEEEELEKESEELEGGSYFDFFDEDEDETEEDETDDYEEIVPMPDLYEDEYALGEEAEEDDPSQLYLFGLHEASEAEEADDEIVISDEQKVFMDKAKEAENLFEGEEEFFDLDDDDEEAVLEEELITDEEEKQLPAFDEEEEVVNAIPLEADFSDEEKLSDEAEDDLSDLEVADEETAEEEICEEAEVLGVRPHEEEKGEETLFEDDEEDESEAPFVRDDGQRPDVTEEELLDEVEDDLSDLEAIDEGSAEEEICEEAEVLDARPLEEEVSAEEEPFFEEDEEGEAEAPFVRDDGQRPEVTEEELLNEVEDDLSDLEATDEGFAEEEISEEAEAINAVPLEEASTEEETLFEEDEEGETEAPFVRDDGQRSDVAEEELLDEVEDDLSALEAVDEIIEEEAEVIPEPEPEPVVSKKPEKTIDKRSLPRVIKKLVTAIGDKSAAPFIKYLASCDTATLVDLDKALSSCIEQVRTESKDKMLNVMGSEVSIVIASDAQSDALKQRSLRNNIGAVMYGHYASSWTAVIAFCSQEGEVTKATAETLSESVFSDYDWKIVRVLGEEIRAKD